MQSIASDMDEEQDSESEDEEGDFVEFDESGARIGGGCGGEVTSPTPGVMTGAAEGAEGAPIVVTTATRTAADDTTAGAESGAIMPGLFDPLPIHQPVRKRHKARQHMLRTFVAGKEGSSEGELRTETLGQRQPGIFAAANYFWLYYAILGSGCTVVPGDIVTKVTTLAEPGQCHAILDDTEDAADADSVPGSNSTYEFAGEDPDADNGTLFRRPFVCRCSYCRNDDGSRPLTERRSCPLASTVGVWQFEAVHSTERIAKKVLAAKLKAQDFARCIEPEYIPPLHSNEARKPGLYAVAGSFLEKGKRPYWLLLAKSKGYKATKSIKSAVGTIQAGWWIIDAHWYVCTSDGQDRKSYKLLVEKDGNGVEKPPELVHVTVGALVQVHGLCFERDFGYHRESILSNDSHLRIMSHVAFLGNIR